MRLALTPDHLVGECHPCNEKDEYQVSSYILCYQTADYLLKNYQGRWEIQEREIVLALEGLDGLVHLEFESGSMSVNSLAVSLYSRYSCELGIKGLVEDIIQDLDWQAKLVPQNKEEDFLFSLFVKLIEIFHARCGLCIRKSPASDGSENWEIGMGREGTQGWVTPEGMAINRFGESFPVEKWRGLRPEKAATYMFGFNRYCHHYPSPLDLVKG